MRLITMLCVSVLLASACAPLNPDSTTMQNLGELGARIVMAPLTLGLSELMIADQRRRDAEATKQRQDYARWMNSLSPERRAQEYQLEQARIQAAGIALLGFGMSGGFKPMPSAPTYHAATVPSPLSCYAGSAYNVTCFKP